MTRYKQQLPAGPKLRLTLDIPQHVRDKLGARADRNRRSMTAEASLIIEEACNGETTAPADERAEAEAN